MNKYSITYDLLKPGKNYDDLYAKLEAIGAYRIQLSQWAVKTQHNATQIRDYLMAALDDNDRLLVAGLTGEAAWKNLLGGSGKFHQDLVA